MPNKKIISDAFTKIISTCRKIGIKKHYSFTRGEVEKEMSFFQKKKKKLFFRKKKVFLSLFFWKKISSYPAEKNPSGGNTQLGYLNISSRRFF